MFNEDTEILFPSRVIPTLRSLRGGEWKLHVDNIIGSAPTSPKHLGFILLMIRLCGCATCSSDSFRGMRGCTQCSKQTIKRFRGDDEELIRLYNEALLEIQNHFTQSG